MSHDFLTAISSQFGAGLLMLSPMTKIGHKFIGLKTKLKWPKEAKFNPYKLGFRFVIRDSIYSFVPY
jgi:hypothetical protein